MGSIVQETLDIHNALREAHGAPPLEWSDECAELAQMQADAMAAAGSIFHDNTEGPSGSHGQNVAMAMPEITPTMAIKMWYNEVNEPGYDYDSPGFTGGTGHFTQVVWAETTHVGLAVNGHYVCANYLPAGNMAMPGYFEENVLPSETTDFDEITAGGVSAPAATTRGIKAPAGKSGGSGSGPLAKVMGLFACCAGTVGQSVADLEDTFDEFGGDEFEAEEPEEEEEEE
jgi:hypothetical protein